MEYFEDVTKFPAAISNKHKFVTGNIGIFLDRYIHEVEPKCHIAEPSLFR